MTTIRDILIDYLKDEDNEGIDGDIDIQNIVETYLETNGYDGLYCDDPPCGCGCEDRLYPCGHVCLNCQPAYRVPASAEFKAEFGDEAKWMFSARKETP